jgi:hypothetical protein
MQTTSMARKARILIDGDEIPGLIKIAEVKRENAAIDVPGFQIIRKIHTGVTTMPEVEVGYEIRRDTKTRKTWRDYFEKKEVHDLTVLYCDADGVEFARQLWSQVECRSFTDPEVDLSSVSYAQVTMTLLPYDIVEVA